MNAPICWLTRCLASGLILAVPVAVIAGEGGGPPAGVSAQISGIDLTTAGHVGANVIVTFPGPEIAEIRDWGTPRIEDGTIFLDATSGARSNGNPTEWRHAYKLLEIDRPPRPPGEAFAFRAVTFPAGTAPIPELEVVLRSREEWDKWIAAYDLTAGPLPIAPPVDFEREMLVCVSLGETSGCHAVEIRRMTAAADGAVLVEYTAAIPAPDKPVTEALINPLHAVAVSRSDGEFSFAREVSVLPAPAADVGFTRPGYPFFFPEQAATVVIRDDAAWSRFLDRVAGPRDPALPAPPADLGTQMLIGVFLGRTPLGHTLMITEVSSNGQEILVNVQETIGGAPPPPDEFEYPFDFIALPQSPLPVRFARKLVALPSPPQGAGAGAPHGDFEVVFLLDGCELVRGSFNLPEVPITQHTVLDALGPGDAGAGALPDVVLDAVFDLGLATDAIVRWEPPLREGRNISVNVSVRPRPQIPVAVDDTGSPGPGSFANRYTMSDLPAGLYRFELRVNTVPAGHVFFLQLAPGVPAGRLDSWLAARLVPPLWEAVPNVGLLGDLDGDGAGDSLEFGLGSDPLDVAKRPVSQVRAPGPGSMEIALTRRLGVSIVLEGSADLRRGWRAADPPPEVISTPRGDDPELEDLILRWSGPEGFWRITLSEDELAGSPLK